jgi:hypothetical protein
MTLIAVFATVMVGAAHAFGGAARPTADASGAAARARHAYAQRAAPADTGAGTGLTYVIDDTVLCTENGVCVERGRIDVHQVMVQPELAETPRTLDTATNVPVIPQNTPTPPHGQRDAGTSAAAAEPMPVVIESGPGRGTSRSHAPTNPYVRIPAPHQASGGHSPTPAAQHTPQLHTQAHPPAPPPADVPALVSAAVVAMLAGIAAGTAAWYAQGWSAGRLARDAWEPRQRDTPGSPQLPPPPSQQLQQRRNAMHMAASGLSTTSTSSAGTGRGGPRLVMSGPREALRQAAEVGHLG